jgi:hypothetical protein
MTAIVFGVEELEDIFLLLLCSVVRLVGVCGFAFGVCGFAALRFVQVATFSLLLVFVSAIIFNRHIQFLKYSL